MPDREIIDFLGLRRSTKLIHMADPGPDAAQLQTLLQVGMRVPDHGKLAPWSITLFQGDARAAFGRIIAARYADMHPDASNETVEKEQARFLRAPLVLAVISRPVTPHKIPVWEQQLSAGALCYNLCLTANGLGFGSNWVTEWIAEDAVIRDHLGCADTHRIAGFLYIGTPTHTQDERERPDPAQCVTRWSPL